jgi:hypothetical protein
MNVDLNDKTIDLYMSKTYQNPQCLSIDEYYDDLKRIKYIKRLLNRYENTGELKERLILNHIIVIYNLFGVDAATRILFFHIDEESWTSLKTFLVFLNFMPEKIKSINGKDIIDSDISINFEIAGKLRSI